MHISDEEEPMVWSTIDQSCSKTEHPRRLRQSESNEESEDVSINEFNEHCIKAR